MTSGAVARALPTFRGTPFNPTAFADTLYTFLHHEGSQLGPIGRRVRAFSPDLLSRSGAAVTPTPVKYFGNRVCPWAHRAFLALAEKGALDKVDYIHVDLKAPKPAWYQVRGGGGRLEALVCSQRSSIKFLDKTVSSRLTPDLPCAAPATPPR